MEKKASPQSENRKTRRSGSRPGPSKKSKAGVASKHAPYPKISVEIGIEKPFRALHISDTHLLFADGRGNEDKYRIAMRRYGEYVYSNIGRNVPYFLDALQYAKENCQILLHTGDLIDFVSRHNLEVAQKLFALSGVDYFICAGNHEYTHYSGQHPESRKEREDGRKLVPAYFKNDLYFASRVINGLNLIALDNGDYQFSAKHLTKLKKEVAKGYPIVLMIHNPLYSPELAKRRVEEEAKAQLALAACPPEAFKKYAKYKPVKANAETKAFISYLKRTPSIKAILAGHVHFHSNHSELLWGDVRQYVVGGGYYGCGEVFEFS